MPQPVKPSDFEKLIVQPDEQLCSALVKVLIKLPILYFKALYYERTGTGEISQDYANDLCAKVYPPET